jgi:hypothetical protein
MKPLFRYTLGPVSNLGFEILKESINLLKKNYDCDIVVCYNQIKNKDILKEINEELIDQEKYTNSLPYAPIKEIWKICPPRLSPNTHEIFLDNDLIITNKIPQIDEFLREKEKTIILSGFTGERHKVNGKEVQKRYYGQYDHFIDQKYIINGGLFGIPPNFDFEDKLKNLCIGNWQQDRELAHNDDQGIITAALTINNEAIVIPEDQILIYDCAYAKYKECNGYHFLESNRNENHTGWDFYKLNKKSPDAG